MPFMPLERSASVMPVVTGLVATSSESQARRSAERAHRRSTAPQRRTARSDSERELVHACFYLHVDELEAIEDLAERRNTTPAQVVSQSLATEFLLQRLYDRGARFVARFGTRGRELVFAHMQTG